MDLSELISLSSTSQLSILTVCIDHDGMGQCSSRGDCEQVYPTLPPSTHPTSFPPSIQAFVSRNALETNITYACSCDSGWSGETFLLNGVDMLCHVPTFLCTMGWTILLFGTMRLGYFSMRAALHQLESSKLGNNKKTLHAHQAQNGSESTSHAMSLTELRRVQSPGYLKGTIRSTLATLKLAWRRYRAMHKTHSKQEQQSIREAVWVALVLTPFQMLTTLFFIFRLPLGVSSISTVFFVLSSVLEKIILLRSRFRAFKALVSVAELSEKDKQDLFCGGKRMCVISGMFLLASFIVLESIITANTSEINSESATLEAELVYTFSPLRDTPLSSLIITYNVLRGLEFAVYARFALIHYRVARGTSKLLRRRLAVFLTGKYSSGGGVQMASIEQDTELRRSNTALMLHQQKSPTLLSLSPSFQNEVPLSPQMPAPLGKSLQTKSFSRLLVGASGIPKHFMMMQFQLDRILANASSTWRVFTLTTVLSFAATLPVFHLYQEYFFIVLALIPVLEDGNIVFSWNAGFHKPSRLCCFGENHVSYPWRSSRSSVLPAPKPRLRRMNTLGRVSKLGFTTSFSERFATFAQRSMTIRGGIDTKGQETRNAHMFSRGTKEGT